jgi:hypothetical protein
MHALVAAQVDPIHRDSREGERRALDGVRRAKIREDRAVVIDVRVNVEEADAGTFDRVTERTDQGTVTPLADIGDRF